MKVHVLQHVPFEGLGCIEAWCAARGATVSVTRFWNGEELPKTIQSDVIIALGGPMSVHDGEECPWLDAEKEFIRAAISSGKATLGICLGAQLIAAALGARVFPNAHKEIGWFPVSRVECDSEVFRFPKEFLAFHWHGETFELPLGAKHVARSVGCENQAFQVGRNVIGLQFHLEATTESVSALVDNCSDELVEGLYIQGPSEILEGSKAHCLTANELMQQVLNYLEHFSEPCSESASYKF